MAGIKLDVPAVPGDIPVTPVVEPPDGEVPDGRLPDAAGVAVVSNVLLSADEKSYAYTALRQGAYLFTVDGVR